MIEQTLRQIGGHDACIEFARRQERQQLLDLAAEIKCAIRLEEIQRFDRKTVPAQYDLACPAIHDGKCPHAIQAIESPLTIFAVNTQYDLCVSSSLECMPTGFQLAA